MKVPKKTHTSHYSLFPSMFFPEVSSLGDTINYCSTGKDHPSPGEPSRKTKATRKGTCFFSKNAGRLQKSPSAKPGRPAGTASRRKMASKGPAWGSAQRKSLEQLMSRIPDISLGSHLALGRRLPNH